MRLLTQTLPVVKRWEALPRARPATLGQMTRPLLSAVILAVGTELTTGSTRDTNSAELAAELTELGVHVRRMLQLPDELPAVATAFADALAEADLVVSTGGLGPTPDDLTREAIAEACRLELRVDDELAAWLRQLFARRGQQMPEANLKQAWLVPGAAALANEQGTAPGWWLELPEGQLVIALPGPPREMRAMWRAGALPRLSERGPGADRASTTLRLTAIGESVLVGLIGEQLLRAKNPRVATYARPDAVDVRVTAFAESNGTPASELVAKTANQLRTLFREHIFAEGDEGWPEALGKLLGERRLAIVELGTGGQLVALLGSARFLQYAQLLRSSTAAQHSGDHLGLYAERVREMSGVDIGLAVRASARGSDTYVEIGIARGEGTALSERTVFLAGEEGRRRAALAACAELWQRLRAEAEARAERRLN